MKPLPFKTVEQFNGQDVKKERLEQLYGRFGVR